MNLSRMDEFITNFGTRTIDAGNGAEQLRIEQRTHGGGVPAILVAGTAAARKRQFDAVVVWRFDRFARSTKHLLLALEEFRSLGVQFISYQENIDTSSPLGQALFIIVSAVAQLERDLIRERVNAGLRNARACGKQLGRPRRVVNHDEVRRLRSEGASLRQIAEKLGVGYGTVRLSLAHSGELKTPSQSAPNGR